METTNSAGGKLFGNNLQCEGQNVWKQLTVRGPKCLETIYSAGPKCLETTNSAGAKSRVRIIVWYAESLRINATHTYEGAGGEGRCV